jgi:hypothetical protein
MKISIFWTKKIAFFKMRLNYLPFCLANQELAQSTKLPLVDDGDSQIVFSIGTICNDRINQ